MHPAATNRDTNRGDTMPIHGTIGEQLTALQRLITEPDHDPEPIRTNWSIVPANDKDGEDLADFKTE